ncbi:MAG: hypothetical protein NWF08_09515 [Candidatus Bathyarchaeota archaeon]|nr:hypothetical protein [Candidatus Bathyarchaeota archaeon]
MNNSLKAGIISGLIAGIVLGIFMEVFSQIAISIGFYEEWLRPLIINNFLVNIPLFVFWGIVLGVIYSKVHSLIPGKGVLKGLVYGLFLYVILVIRGDTFMIPYGLFLMVAGDLFSGIFIWPAYGLALGFFYQFLHNKYYPTKEEPKIITYSMKSGLLPGAIAGLMEGVAAGFVSVIGHLTGRWGVPVGGEIISTISYWASQFGTHMLINMIWGTVFGAFFALVYNLVPGKKVLKGLYFGLLMFFITTFQLYIWLIVWSANHDAWQLVSVWILNIFVYGFDFVVFGLVLGLLYRKPVK